MSRIIKFRAWDHQDMAFRYSDTYDGEGYFTWQLSEFFEFNGDGCTFQQFTGILDKNGKEIYEGDILELESEFLKGKTIFICERYFSAATSGFRLQNRNAAWHHGGQSTDCEIIGNIFENPKLLKKEEPPNDSLAGTS